MEDVYLPPFIRIGNRAMNMAQVTQIEGPMTFDNRPCILIRFDADNYTRVSPREEGYDVLLAWIGRQPTFQEKEA